MRARGWLARLRSLGSAVLDLLAAELAAIGEDLHESARQLRSGAALLLIGAFFGFWTIGTLVFAAIELVDLWLPRWGAVLVVGGVFALLTLGFVLLGRARLRRLESPAKTVSRRLGGHTAWVQEQLLREPDQE